MSSILPIVVSKLSLTKAMIKPIKSPLKTPIIILRFLFGFMGSVGAIAFSMILTSSAFSASRMRASSCFVLNIV